MARGRSASPTVLAASPSVVPPTSRYGTPTIRAASAMRWAARRASASSRTARSCTGRRFRPLRDKLLHWLDSERDRQLEFLQAFTRIDTCNPPGDTTEAAEFFRKFLDAEGIAHRTEAPQKTFPNLISSFAGQALG